MSDYRLTHLKQLEAESIHIIREVAAEFDNPVMLYSIGKDSAVMLHLAQKAFYPGKLPFPLLLPPGPLQPAGQSRQGRWHRICVLVVPCWRREYPMDRVLLRTLVSASKNLFLFSSSASRNSFHEFIIFHQCTCHEFIIFTSVTCPRTFVHA